jgi:hypothetical protein
VPVPAPSLVPTPAPSYTSSYTPSSVPSVPSVSPTAGCLVAWTRDDDDGDDDTYEEGALVACAGHGVCDAVLGTCACYAGYAGDRCEEASETQLKSSQVGDRSIGYAAASSSPCLSLGSLFFFSFERPRLPADDDDQWRFNVSDTLHLFKPPTTPATSPAQLVNVDVVWGLVGLALRGSALSRFLDASASGDNGDGSGDGGDSGDGRNNLAFLGGRADYNERFDLAATETQVGASIRSSDPRVPRKPGAAATHAACPRVVDRAAISCQWTLRGKLAHWGKHCEGRGRLWGEEGELLTTVHLAASSSPPSSAGVDSRVLLKRDDAARRAARARRRRRQRRELPDRRL